MDSVKFNFVHFIDFLYENNVFAAAISSVLSERISDLTDTLVNSLIMPIINRDADGDGKKDIGNLESATVTVLGAKLEVGRVVVTLVKFFIVTYAIFIVSGLMHKPHTG